MIRLLYIDDNPETCEIITAFCDHIGGFSLNVVSSEEAALEWLSRSAADVIVSDYEAPGGIDGIMLLKELHTRGCTMPFILFTGHDSREIRESAYHNGAFKVIGKSAKGGSPMYRLFRSVSWAADLKEAKRHGQKVEI